jgi:Tol biopolymer transport system component
LPIRTLYLPALVVAGVLVACAAALTSLALSEKAEAALAGKKGKIAYVFFGRNGGIYTKNPDGGGKTKVTNGEQPAYSPNGKRIAYVGSDGIYTINVGGGGKTKVTEGSAPSYSPNGKKIAFGSFGRSGYSEIYTINVGGGQSLGI